jgi:hypothetical protein
LFYPFGDVPCFIQNDRGRIIGIVFADLAFLDSVAIRHFFRKVGNNKETANPDAKK